MTTEEIIDRASKRYNSAYQNYGMLTREDVIDFFKTLTPEQDRKTELMGFLDKCTFIQPLTREKLLNDLPSYGL